MAHFDVFNGDADGICALHQLRLADPRASTLVTGVKRDIQLLERVQAAAGDTVTALDISLDSNRSALEALLADSVRITYIDHHYAGEIPESPCLDVLIDTAPNTCTALLADRRLHGAQRAWAVVGAFGDNLCESAAHAAQPLGLDRSQLDRLRQLGTYINYNGYGTTVEDLYFHPAALYRRLAPYPSPFEFIEAEDVFQQLHRGYNDDITRARRLTSELATEHTALYLLPDAAWSRRVVGVFGNELAGAHPRRAHALLTHRPGGGFVVSVRAPRDVPQGADELCRQFPTGGGRKTAAGINHLPEDQVESFTRALQQAYP